MDGLLQGIKLGVTKNKEVQKELDSNEESFMTDIQREGQKKRRFAKSSRKPQRIFLAWKSFEIIVS